MADFHLTMICMVFKKSTGGLFHALVELQYSLHC